MSYLQYSAIIYFFSLALCFVLYIEWKKARLDRFRYNLFRIRNNLFKAAVDGKLQFSDDAYILARANLNGMIRYSHDVSLFSLYLFKRLGRKEIYRARSESYRKRMSVALSSLGAEGKAEIDGVFKSMHHQVMSHVAFNSLPAIIMTSVLFFWFVVVALLSKVKDSGVEVHMETSPPFEGLARRIDALDIEVTELGCAA